MRYLGIDYGDKKIGLALGDDETKIAGPFEVIENKPDIVERLSTIIKSEDIDALVVGTPLKTGGHHGPKQLNKTMKFVEKIRAGLGIEVHEEDESFTTVESIRLRRHEGATAPEDAIAAMLILQQFLDK